MRFADACNMANGGANGVCWLNLLSPKSFRMISTSSSCWVGNLKMAGLLVSTPFLLEFAKLDRLLSLRCCIQIQVIASVTTKI